MAWTQRVTDVPIGDWCEEIHTVAVDGRVYAFGFKDSSQEDDGMQVLIFYPKTCTWDLVPRPTREEGRGTDRDLRPKRGLIDFVVAIDQKAYVCGGGQRSSKNRDVHIFDTKTLQWNRVCTNGDVPSGNLWVCICCVMETQVFIFADCSEGSHVWSLDLSTMLWKRIAKGTWSKEYYIPRFTAPYENRIYSLLSRPQDKDRITYFDLVKRKWECLRPHGRKPFCSRSKHFWLPFVHRQHLYVLLTDMEYDDYDIGMRFGDRKMNEVVLRYSFERNKWEQVYFGGVTPSILLEIVCVVDNKAVFFSSAMMKAYVLDFLPSLRTLCLQAIRKHKLDATYLPEILKRELLLNH